MSKFNKGDKVIMIDCFEAKINPGKEYIIDGEQREMCGSQVIAISNLDGTRKSACFDADCLSHA